ncbi:MAG: hypothetical protein M3296_09550 [Actinomycetota bacterium]|nr:hypothetical protein [Actinomycetota bacterium]
MGELLAATNPAAGFHLFDPNPAVGDRYRRQLDRELMHHAGLPDGVGDLNSLLEHY